MSDEHLTDLERRLAGWRPASDALDADAMLFAAGRASVRRSRSQFAWPAIAACLAVAVGILGMQLSAERAENQSLIAQLSNAETDAFVPSQPSATPNYLIARQSWVNNPDYDFHHEPLESDAVVADPILRAGERNAEIP
jgi:hypothetical protein